MDTLSAEHSTWSTEELYQRARKIVGAELQAITFNEFLPALLGPYAPAPTGHYDPSVNPTILNEFPTVFMRIGHSMLTDSIKRVQNDGQPSPAGAVDLVDAFNNPALLTTSSDLDLFLKGLSVEVQEETDLKFVDGMREALLDAFDIQRARDHGLPDYNTFRAAYGLPKVTSYANITSDPATQQAIAAVYPNINTIDPFVIAHCRRSLAGRERRPAGCCRRSPAIRTTSRRRPLLYDNDTDFTPPEIAALHQLHLSDIIRRNSGITNLQTNVFFTVPEPSSLFFVAFCYPWFAR